MRLFKRKSKNKPIVKDLSEQYGTQSDVRQFFERLIKSYVDKFRVDSPRQILEAYRTVPQLQTLINNSADAFIRADKVLYNINAKGVKTIDNSSDLFHVLENPHPLQTKNEFWKSVYINWSLFGRQHTYKRILSGFGLVNMIVWPSVDVITVLQKNPKYLQADNISDIVLWYLLDQGNGVINKITDLDSIWTLREASLSTQENGLATNENPLKAYEKTLGTLKIISHIKNELLGNHGAIGIIHPKAHRDEVGGSQPWTSVQKKEVQDAYNDYGLTRGKNKLIITNQEIGFTAISLKIAELQLNEFEVKATETLANGKNYPIVLMSGLKQYKNKDAGTKDLYENKIMPETDIILSSFNANLKLPQQGKVFEFNFSKIAALQIDQKKETDRKKIETDIITQINKDVKDAVTDRQTAINRLIDIGRTEKEAEQLVSPLISNINTT